MPEVTELEVRGFLRMNVMQKERLRQKDVEKYNELFKQANELFPATDDSVEMEISDKGGK